MSKKIIIPEMEFFNEETSEFIYFKEQILTLEHSLVSISKWESKWKKPYLSKIPKTSEEIIDYVKCMTITQNVNPIAYSALTEENYDEIGRYIEDDMTATTFRDIEKKGSQRSVITSEVIYYWMIKYGVPFECQKWHLNRLLTLIRVCAANSGEQKKMSTSEIYSQNRALNEMRRKSMRTRG